MNKSAASVGKIFSTHAFCRESSALLTVWQRVCAGNHNLPERRLKDLAAAGCKRCSQKQYERHLGAARAGPGRPAAVKSLQ